MEGTGIGFVPLDTNYLAAIEESLQPQVKKKKKLTKAEKNERKRLAEIEFRKQEMYSTLAREVELSRKNYYKQQIQWEELCGGIKLKELKEELKEWTDKTERWFKEKDEKIDSLLQELQDSVWLNQRAHSSRAQLFAYLNDTYTSLLELSKLNYEVNVDKIITDFLEGKEAHENYGKAIIEQCNKRFTCTMAFAAQEAKHAADVQITRKMEVINDEILRRYERRDEILAKMTAMSDNLHKFVAVISDTSLDVEKYKRLNNMMTRSQHFSNEAKRLNNYEFKKKRNLNEINRQYQWLQIETQQQISYLRLDKTYYRRIQRQIDTKIQVEREETFRKTEVLARISAATLEKLEHREKEGNLIISMITNCRKLETLAQKVLPYGDFTPHFDETPDENLWLDTIDLKAFFGFDKETYLSELKNLNNFLRRMSLVQGQTAIMQKIRSKLLEKKENYIKIIKMKTKTEDPVELTTALSVTELQVHEPLKCDKYMLKARKKKSNTAKKR